MAAASNQLLNYSPHTEGICHLYISFDTKPSSTVILNGGHLRMAIFTKNGRVLGNVQSGASSQAKHGGAYFSAVYGSIEVLLAAPGPYENL